MKFSVIQPFPGVTHITDVMGVSFTLIEGCREAVLFDTGYGMEDAGSFVETLTDKPVTVLLSHGHHDHILGARWFKKSYLCKEDLEEFRARTGELQRTKVKAQAGNACVKVPEDFMTAVIPLPEPIRFTGETAGFESLKMDLGGREILVLRVPGHTPGSIVIYIADAGLLLTGDNWNPCTWMWFPSSIAADKWRGNMKHMLNGIESAYAAGIRNVICSHQPMVREGTELKDFLDYMTDDRLREAPAVDMGAPIDTHRIEREQWTLVFDMNKIKYNEND